MRIISLILLLLVSCKEQEEDTEKLILSLPPLEKLTYNKEASEKLLKIEERFYREFYRIKGDEDIEDEEKHSLWDTLSKETKSGLINIIKKYPNSKSALSVALLYLGGSEKCQKYIGENYKGTWQAIVATSRLGGFLPRKMIKITNKSLRTLFDYYTNISAVEYHYAHLDEYRKLDRETDPEYLQWVSNNITDSVRYYYDKKAYFGASEIEYLAFEYFSLDDMEKFEKLLKTLFTEYPSDCVEKSDVNSLGKILAERKHKIDWLKSKGIEWEAFKKMDAKEWEKLNKECETDWYKIPEDERTKMMCIIGAEFCEKIGDKSELYACLGTLANKWSDTPEGKEAYKKWIALIRGHQPLAEWLRDYGLSEKDLTDKEVISMDNLRNNEEPSNKIWGIDEQFLAKCQKETSDILTKRPDWQEWLKDKEDISKAKPTDILEWRKEWSKSKAKDSNPSIK